VTLAPSRAGTPVHEDNLGEFETRLLLFQLAKDQGLSVAGASGWDGDRYQVVNTPAGSALGWVTVWDTPVDAVEFRDVMERAVEKRYGLKAASGGTGDERRWTTPRGRRVSLAMTTLAGRAVVLFEDVPGATSGRVIAPERVTLREP
jgi:hypothetical protein